MPRLTVFTPTYNRADLLKRCYESLKNQTNKDFIWLIIDDGSEDSTRSIVRKWTDECNQFKILYTYKENGGLASAYNTAIEQITTELCVCIDSDDYMPPNAVDTILDFWNKNGSDKYAGIVGLDCYEDGKVVGDLLPKQKSVNLIDLLTGKYNIINGDRTNVVRTDLYKEVAPMHLFDGEKNFNPHYMHLQISEKYDFLVLNKNLRYVDYQQDGMSASILRQYRNSPNSFAETRKLYLTFKNTSLKFKIRHSIHYMSSCFLANKPFRGIKESPKPILSIFCFIPGAILTVCILIKTRDNKND